MRSEESNKDGNIGHNSGVNAMRVETLPLSKIIVWQPAQDLANDVQPLDIDNEREVIQESGQKAPLPAREREDGRVEVVAQDVHSLDQSGSTQCASHLSLAAHC